MNDREKSSFFSESGDESERILIVDGDPSMRTALMETVKRLGYSVQGAVDGMDAIERITRFRPWMVLTDLRMPRLNGLELIKEVRARAPQATIVLMTAYGAIETAVEAMKLGASEYLLKPFSMDVLERVIANLKPGREEGSITGHPPQPTENRALRARLVDAVDAVLDLLDRDPGAHFVLDGQVVLLEDYLALRPERRDALVRGIRAGRLAIGPWYVEPDSFLPSGESHVRNLLLGRLAGETFGPLSRTAYVPDSFGHPAQFPQLLAGFGLGPFVYWRGDGDAFDAHADRYRWVAPDGSEVPALVLRDGYFNAAFLPDDVDAAARGLAAVAERLAAAGDEPVVLMNGFDHMFPDTHVGRVAAALAERTGWEVRRTLLDALRDEAPPAATHRGALDGARLTNLLPGVWSAPFLGDPLYRMQGHGHGL